MIHATPFQPFVIHLAGGRQLVVQHRDFVDRSESGRTAVIYQADGSFSIVDLLLVAELEVPLSMQQPR